MATCRLTVLLCATVLLLGAPFPATAMLPIRSALSLPGFAYDVAVFDSVIFGVHVAFVSTDSGLASIDISNPRSLKLLGFIRLPGRGKELTVHYNYAYVTGSRTKAVHIVDLTDLRNPRLVGSVGDSAGYAWGIDWTFSPPPAVPPGTDDSNDRVIMPTAPLMCVATLSGARLFDISSPVQPVALSVFSPYRSGFAPTDSFAFTDTGGPNPAKVEDVCLMGNEALVLFYDPGLDGSHLRLKRVDLSVPLSPRAFDSLDLYNMGCGMRVSCNYAYIAHAGGWLREGGLDIINLTTVPMKREGSIRLTGAGEDVAIVNNVAYVASGACVSVVRLTDPGNPVLLDTCALYLINTPCSAQGIEVMDTSIFVAAGPAGLMVLGIPRSLSAVNGSPTVRSIPSQGAPLLTVDIAGRRIADPTRRCLGICRYSDAKVLRSLNPYRRRSP